MIGMKYMSGLLAELVKTPRLGSMEVSTAPNGRWVSSFTKRYMDGWGCETTLFDVGDAELTSMVVGCEVSKVAVSASPKGLSVSFVVDRWPEDGLGKRVVVLSSAASVELGSGVCGVSAIEEAYIDADKISSFFEDETSGEPWLVVVEPD